MKNIKKIKEIKEKKKLISKESSNMLIYKFKIINNIKKFFS